MNLKKLTREHKQFGKKDTFKKLKEVRQQLDEVLTYKAEGALRYINRKYYEMGNKASRLLAFQLRKAQSSPAVPKIRNPETSQVETDPTKISDSFATYYKLLYKAEELEFKEEKTLEFLRPLKMNKLSTEEAELLIKLITESEIKETITKNKNNKTPGTDSFSGEYYKIFVNELTPILCKLDNYVLKSGDPPKLMVGSHIISDT